MDAKALATELDEAIHYLHRDNLVMAERLTANVLIKIRAHLHARMHERLDLERAEFIKRCQTDPDGRRVYEVIETKKPRKPTKNKEPRKRSGWIQDLLNE